MQRLVLAGYPLEGFAAGVGQALREVEAEHGGYLFRVYALCPYVAGVLIAVVGGHKHAGENLAFSHALVPQLLRQCSAGLKL